MKTKLLKKIRQEVDEKIIVMQTNKGYIISFYGILDEHIITDLDVAVKLCQGYRRKKIEEIVMFYRAKKYINKYKRVY